MQKSIHCWCGNQPTLAFSDEYLICQSCKTLVSQVGLAPEKIIVNNDEEDFYGKNYWLSHQSQDLGYPDIFKRSRSDLSERCMHWLKTILKYKLPPAKTLELGCAHGGFVSLLQQCGYDASGLEMSPSVAEIARKTFQISMLVGPIEKQEIAPASLDMIIMMDVMEHLPNPTATFHHCLKLLKPDGVLVIQTPQFPLGKSHAEMVTQNDPFLAQLKSDEHLFLFSEPSIQQFFQQVTNDQIYLQFEPAMFAQYDMFLMVSKSPFNMNSVEQIENFFTASPSVRLIQAMLDLTNQRDTYLNLYQQADADRVARLKIIKEYEKYGTIKYTLKKLGRKLREKIHS